LEYSKIWRKREEAKAATHLLQLSKARASFVSAGAGKECCNEKPFPL